MRLSGMDATSFTDLIKFNVYFVSLSYVWYKNNKKMLETEHLELFKLQGLKVSCLFLLDILLKYIHFFSSVTRP
jgi:hypothetical protein